jgi:ABC-type polysaccharide/polyol phosphate transport system ATPase subunit
VAGCFSPDWMTISTLLQVIDTLNPINRRIAALLELGSGFNPEFSGMSRAIYEYFGAGRKHRQQRYFAYFCSTKALG